MILITLAKFPFQNARIPSSYFTLRTQSITPLYYDYILFCLSSYGIVCNRVLTISSGKVTVLRIPMPTKARISLPIKVALLYVTLSSIVMVDY